MAEQRGFLQPGSNIAGYSIIRLIGAGGMGQVYLAQHPRLPRQDAVKVLFPHLIEDESFRARFHREASLAAQLSHPNIVAVYDTGEDDGVLWLSMQYVDGTDAARLIKNHPEGVPAAQAVDIIAQAGRGLDRAHAMGMLHRDIKPANLLITGDWEHDDPHSHQVLVSDFGIARTLANSTQLTGTGSILATISYAAPEILRAERVDHRADIYALGCTLHQLLTGQTPFPRPDTGATMLAHILEPPPRPAELRPGLPRGLNDVIATAMAKNPDERFQTCKALTQAATAALSGGAFTPPPPPVLPDAADTAMHTAGIPPTPRSAADPTVAQPFFGQSTPPPPPPPAQFAAPSTPPPFPPPGAGTAAPAPAAAAPKKQGSGGGKAVALALGGVVLLSVVGGLAYVGLTENRDDRGSGGEAESTATDEASPETTTEEAELPADEQCTDAIMSNSRWACITSAVLQNDELTIEYDAEWAGEEPNINGQYHLHVWGAQDGDNPAVYTMGVPNGGSWLVKDDSPVVLSAEEVSTYIGDNPKVCFRIANGNHELVPDDDGGYATGNCWPIERE